MNDNINPHKIRQATIHRVINVLCNGIILSKQNEDIPSTCLMCNKSNQTVFKYNIYGVKSELEFLSDLFPLHSMLSTDLRFSDAYGDIVQHTINNYDWNDNWIFSDERFNLKSEKVFSRFLPYIFHEEVRDNSVPWWLYFDKINSLLKEDGFELCLYKDEDSGWEMCRIQNCCCIKVQHANNHALYELNQIGKGSYATVFKYKDKFYENDYVVKRLKQNASAIEISRFKQEFETMKKLKSPYVIRVYKYDSCSNQYIMESADFTLLDYLKTIIISKQRVCSI